MQTKLDGLEGYRLVNTTTLRDKNLVWVHFPQAEDLVMSYDVTNIWKGCFVVE